MALSAFSGKRAFFASVRMFHLFISLIFYRHA